MTKKDEAPKDEAPKVDRVDVAQALYERFCSRKILEGGLPLPPFSGLHSSDQNAWLACADFVVDGPKKAPEA